MTHHDDSDVITNLTIEDTLSTEKKLSIIEMVKLFHTTFGHPAPAVLDTQLGDPALRKLRAELIREEFVDELLPALGLEISTKTGQLVFLYDGLNPVEPDVTEAADALTDILWVTIGAMLAFGMDPYALMSEVHRSNMSKLGKDGKPILRTDGKIMKGPNYSAPNIKKALGLL